MTAETTYSGAERYRRGLRARLLRRDKDGIPRPSREDRARLRALGEPDSCRGDPNRDVDTAPEYLREK